MTGGTLFGAGWLLVVGSAAYATTVAPRSNADAAVTRLARTAVAVEDRYGRSRRGRRLAARLAAARMPIGPARWRVAQALVIVPVTASLAWVAGVPAPTALLVAVSAVRLGGRVLLMARGGRRDGAVSKGVAHLCRTLAAELDTGAPAAEAMARSVPELTTAGHREVAAMLHSVLARHRAGAAVDGALCGVFASAQVGAVARRDLAAAATVITVQRSGGTPAASLVRVASAIEQRLRIEQEVVASMREPRVVAAAIPVLAMAVATVLVGADPGAATVLAAPFGAVMVGGGALAAVLGVLAVRAATAP